ncbi:MAG TPA: HypC/HybG/HupF family hydrogenase formation chaperone [Thermoplasmata archaeon]|nr:HypC/HybG/HupF family hydrogenase formation chaperone [Thermoplasmata archaeon]
MCLATPGRIIGISETAPGFPVAQVDYGPVQRSAQLIYVPEARVGDYVIVQAGFAIRRLSEAEAREALELAHEVENELPGPFEEAGNGRYGRIGDGTNVRGRAAPEDP